LPRIARVTAIQFPHLIIAKSIVGSSLFCRDEDYEDYLTHLRQLVRDRFVDVFGFCLQQDELRLVVAPCRMELARIIQRLHTSHSLRMNARGRRKGALFKGRFLSLMFSPADLPSAVRSVHLWPVRVGLTRRAQSYRWSSTHAYATHGDQKLDFVNSKEVLLQFSPSLSLAQRAFMKFTESVALERDDHGISESIVDFVDDGFTSHRVQHSLKNLAKRVALLMNVTPAHLIGPSRRQDLVMGRRLLATYAVWFAKRAVTEVAHFLGRDKAQVSRLVSQGMDLYENNVPFRVLFDSMEGRNQAIGKDIPQT